MLIYFVYTAYKQFDTDPLMHSSHMPISRVINDIAKG